MCACFASETRCIPPLVPLFVEFLTEESECRCAYCSSNRKWLEQIWHVYVFRSALANKCAHIPFPGHSFTEGALLSRALHFVLPPSSLAADNT